MSDSQGGWRDECIYDELHTCIKPTRINYFLKIETKLILQHYYIKLMGHLVQFLAKIQYPPMVSKKKKSKLLNLSWSLS